MDNWKGTKGKWISRYNGNYWEVNREVDFTDVPDKNLEDVIAGKKTIYEAIAA